MFTQIYIYKSVSNSILSYELFAKTALSVFITNTTIANVANSIKSQNFVLNKIY
jgi:hypothetical protein